MSDYQQGRALLSLTAAGVLGVMAFAFGVAWAVAAALDWSAIAPWCKWLFIINVVTLVVVVVRALRRV